MRPPVDRDGPSPYNLDDGQAGSLHSRHVGNAGRLAKLAGPSSRRAAGRPWRRRCATTMRRRSRRRARSATTSLLDYAADLEARLRALPEKPVVIGHSMGGLIALLLCARGLARAGVLLDPRAAGQRDRDPALEPRGLRPHPDELGLVAQAAPRDARRGAVAHLQHHRLAAKAPNDMPASCMIPVAPCSRWRCPGSMAARRRRSIPGSSPCRCCSWRAEKDRLDAARRRAPRRAMLRACFGLCRISRPGPLGGRPAGLGAGRRRCGHLAGRQDGLKRWRSSTSRN